MSAVLQPAAPYPPLDGAHRHWPETNCAVDLWLTALERWGEQPLALLGFTAAIDFEGDQFTFVKPPAADLAALYGITVEELQVFRGLEAHLAVQLARDALPMVEVDSFHLPDTRGTDYAITHRKTTIGVIAIDPRAKHLRYLHNRTQGQAEGADYDGLLASPLPPYAEIAKRDPARDKPDAEALAGIAARLLPRHLAQGMRHDPVAAFADSVAAELALLRGAGAEAFHAWAFATLRQLGAAFELLGLHAAWLGAQTGRDVAQATALCAAVAEGAKTLQFRAARLVARGAANDDSARLLLRIGRARRDALAALARAFG